MLSLHEFRLMKEADGNQQNPGYGMQVPIGQKAQNPNLDPDLEEIKSQIRPILAKLYAKASQTNMSKQQAITLLTSIIQQLSSDYGLSASYQRKALSQANRPQ